MFRDGYRTYVQGYDNTVVRSHRSIDEVYAQTCLGWSLPHWEDPYTQSWPFRRHRVFVWKTARLGHA